MRAIFLAGPYNARDNWSMSRNVDIARTVALAVWRIGCVPVSPHVMSGLEYFGAIPEALATRGCLELLGRCDALLVLPFWETSPGTKGEIIAAGKAKIPAFYASAISEFPADLPAELREWVKKE